ncbi:Peptidyl-tRNA hydrolase [Corynebacterium glaucum]|uniref:Peptidyl-tRNA hydrolase n=2 Tax=Corynebacterium glaucum TaxID=187491 RepID=A0A1Q2HVB4_9CORY|nr:aminoacyl-tRNA hydrolase [Corynebacterium glaucum]AQQ14798.1 Peptidyl-tRNA hydrolase [Corynebacterium glaucum]WJZ07305.1 Peptidyl-tRNA hydrolase [Corynebacterium glaucum]
MLTFIRAMFRARSSSPTKTASPQDLVADLAADWLVVGLGNPGDKYAATRHNVGYMVLDELGAQLQPARGFKALVDVQNNTAYARSTTYMNTSGEAVGPLATKLGIPPERIIVIHDELDLPAGKVRVKLGGNENGHNGLKSITEALGTRDYLRVRVGIGRPPQSTAVTDWVLGPVEEDIEAQLQLAAEAVHLLIDDSLQAAQNTIHAKS